MIGLQLFQTSVERLEYVSLRHGVEFLLSGSTEITPLALTITPDLRRVGALHRHPFESCRGICLCCVAAAPSPVAIHESEEADNEPLWRAFPAPSRWPFRIAQCPRGESGSFPEWSTPWEMNSDVFAPIFQRDQRYRRRSTQTEKRARNGDGTNSGGKSYTLCSLRLVSPLLCHSAIAYVHIGTSPSRANTAS